MMMLAVPRPSLTAAIGSLTDHPMFAEIAAPRPIVRKRPPSTVLDAARSLGQMSMT